MREGGPAHARRQPPAQELRQLQAVIQVGTHRCNPEAKSRTTNYNFIGAFDGAFAWSNPEPTCATASERWFGAPISANLKCGIGLSAYSLFLGPFRRL